MIGIAFSVGFVFGPMIGAAYAKWSHGQEGAWFVQPALLAVVLTIINIIFVTFTFKESLPKVINYYFECISFKLLFTIFHFIFLEK